MTPARPAGRAPSRRIDAGSTSLFRSCGRRHGCGRVSARLPSRLRSHRATAPGSARAASDSEKTPPIAGRGVEGILTRQIEESRRVWPLRGARRIGGLLTTTLCPTDNPHALTWIASPQEPAQPAKTAPHHPLPGRRRRTYQPASFHPVTLTCERIAGRHAAFPRRTAGK